MKLDQKVARAPEINPLNITNDEKQKENRDADQFFSILLSIQTAFVNLQESGHSGHIYFQNSEISFTCCVYF